MHHTRIMFMYMYSHPEVGFVDKFVYGREFNYWIENYDL